MMNCEPHYGLKLHTAPAEEPITTAQVKTHLRVDVTEDDATIAAWIIAVRVHVERWLNRRLVSQTWDMTRDGFPVGSREILLPYGPVQSITSISYINTGGTTSTMDSSDYTLDTYSVVPRLYPAFGEIWPATRDIQNAVTIRYVAGFGDAAAVPENIKIAMKMMIAAMYEYREAMGQIPPLENLCPAAESLLWTEKVISL